MKVIVAGGRDFNNYTLLEERLKFFFQNITEEIEIVSGTAKGADSLGERFARENGLKLKQFPADWNRFGKSAGYKRNEQMAKYADALVAFWNGISKGTGHMINLAKEYDLKIRIVSY